jgi:hypothetical protein
MTPGELAAVRGRLEEFAAEMFAPLPRRDQRDKGAAIPSNRRDLKLADLGPPACSRSLLMGVARSRGPGRAEGPSFGLGLDPGEDDAMLGGREQAGHAALLGAGPAVEVCS